MTDNDQLAQALLRLRRTSEATATQMSAALVRMRSASAATGAALAPILAFEHGRRLGFEQGIAASNEYSKAAEDFEREAATLEAMRDG